MRGSEGEWKGYFLMRGGERMRGGSGGEKMYNSSTPMPTHQLSDSNRRIMGSHNDNRARNLRVYQVWKGNNVTLPFQLVSPSLSLVFSSLSLSVFTCLLLSCFMLSAFFFFLALTQPRFLAFKPLYNFLAITSVMFVLPVLLIIVHTVLPKRSFC